MKELIFDGYSDDTFACSGPGIDIDHDNCANGKPIQMRVEADGSALIVSGQYALGKCAGWLIGVAPADFDDDEERHIPEWPIFFRPGEREYSPQLVIQAPDNVTVRLVRK